MTDENEVLTIVRIGMEMQFYLLKGSVKAILQLFQLMKRMEKKGLLKGGEMKNFTAFMHATQGQFQILNIPTEDPGQLADMKKDFEKLGISYVTLPDLNPHDGMTQIAYYIPHTSKVEAWYQSFCMSRLQGGEKDYRQLRNLTEGNASIVSIPWTQEVEKLKEDLDKMRVNYAVIPDLNIGDGYVQILYANADAPSVRAWYELYQKDMLKKDTPIEEMKNMTLEEYAGTGKLSADAYSTSASEEVRKQIGEPDKGVGNPDFKKALDASEHRMLSVHEERYLKMKEQPHVAEITINESLIRSQSEELNLLLVRIPGTYRAGEKEELDVMLPLNEVFVTDEEKTYIAFLDMEKEYRTFTYHPDEENPFRGGPNMKGKELYGNGHFEPVTRPLDRLKKTPADKRIKTGRVPEMKK